MTRTKDYPTNSDNLIDSRDVIARIEELRNAREHENTLLADHPAEPMTPAKQTRIDNIADIDEELRPLEALAEEASTSSDWEYGATLIRNSYFEEYAHDLAEDIGAINRDASWPNNCIDWERAARELQMDYTSVDFDGVTYWVR